ALMLLLLALVLAAFIQQNGQDVVIEYFQWRTIPLPLSLLMILAFAGGYALALVLGFSSGVRNRLRLAGARKEVRQLTKELDSLRDRQETGPGNGSRGHSTSPAGSAVLDVSDPSERDGDFEGAGERGAKGEP
ncbi:MAG: LapA family protein, partial [Proteobacteria bacterium]|nr:LapA family protein [Pseudomonadota bacterium]